MRVQVGSLTLDSNDDIRADVYRLDITVSSGQHMELDLFQARALAHSLRFILGEDSKS